MRNLEFRKINPDEGGTLRKREKADKKASPIMFPGKTMEDVTCITDNHIINEYNIVQGEDLFI